MQQDKRFMRPAGIEQLIGDPAKARQVLDWGPKVGFEELIQMLIDNDLQEQRALARL